MAASPLSPSGVSFAAAEHDDALCDDGEAPPAVAVANQIPAPEPQPEEGRLAVPAGASSAGGRRTPRWEAVRGQAAAIRIQRLQRGRSARSAHFQRLIDEMDAEEERRREAFLAETLGLLDGHGVAGGDERRKMEEKAIARATRAEQHNSAHTIQRAFRARAAFLGQLRREVSHAAAGAVPFDGVPGHGARDLSVGHEAAAKLWKPI
eukprot:SAG22_NODE_160_length_16938_cov_3.491241_8_plen_207_part_00